MEYKNLNLEEIDSIKINDSTYYLLSKLARDNGFNIIINDKDKIIKVN